MRSKQVATTKSEKKNVAFKAISTVSDAKTNGVNNEHNTTAFYVGEMPSHEEESGKLGTMSYTLLSSRRTQHLPCGNKKIELSGTH